MKIGCNNHLFLSFVYYSEKAFSIFIMPQDISSSKSIFEMRQDGAPIACPFA
jgi:hypothetical protein